VLTNLGPSLIVLAVLAACGGPSKPSPASPPPPPTPGEKAAAGESCQQAVDVLFAVTSAKEAPDIRARASKVFVHRCEADRWSAEVRHCMVGIKAPDDGDRCEALLPPEQKRELGDELARELDAAGVKPEMDSGKPRQPSAGKAGAKADAKAGDQKAEEKKKASETKDEAKKSSAAPRGAPGPKPATKAAKPGRADPCEGGE
jgi:hypothetical protein